MTAVAVLVALATPALAAETPFRPSDPALVLERLPWGGAARDPETVRLATLARARPEELAPALALAERYLALGRQRQDSRFMGYAQAALQRWWELPDAPLEVRTVRAVVLQHVHAFDAALAELEQVLAEDPELARAWLSKASIHLVLGEPDRALRSCEALAPLVRPLVGAVCQAEALARMGRAADAQALLEMALTRDPPADPALAGWAHSALAEIAAGRGDLDGARRQFEMARAADPGDVWITVAMADLLLASGDPAAALALVDDDAQSDLKLLRVALAEQQLGRAGLPARITALEALFAEAAARGDALRLREEARFRLELTGEPTRALALAIENWAVQREVEDARLMLAAAHAMDDPAAAAPVLDWLAMTGCDDVRLTRLRDDLLGEAG